MLSGQKLADYLNEANPEYTCRVLDDGSVACMFDLMFTRAIVTGATEATYNRRFCFDDRLLAVRRFKKLKSADEIPDGFIARRGAP